MDVESNFKRVQASMPNPSIKVKSEYEIYDEDIRKVYFTYYSLDKYDEILENFTLKEMEIGETFSENEFEILKLSAAEELNEYCNYFYDEENDYSIEIDCIDNLTSLYLNIDEYTSLITNIDLTPIYSFINEQPDVYIKNQALKVSRIFKVSEKYYFDSLYDFEIYNYMDKTFFINPDIFVDDIDEIVLNGNVEYLISNNEIVGIVLINLPKSYFSKKEIEFEKEVAVYKQSSIKQLIIPSLYFFSVVLLLLLFLSNNYINKFTDSDWKLALLFFTILLIIILGLVYIFKFTTKIYINNNILYIVNLLSQKRIDLDVSQIVIIPKTGFFTSGFELHEYYQDHLKGDNVYLNNFSYNNLFLFFEDLNNTPAFRLDYKTKVEDEVKLDTRLNRVKKLIGSLYILLLVFGYSMFIPEKVIYIFALIALFYFAYRYVTLNFFKDNIRNHIIFNHYGFKIENKKEYAYEVEASKANIYTASTIPNHLLEYTENVSKPLVIEECDGMISVIDLKHYNRQMYCYIECMMLLINSGDKEEEINNKLTAVFTDIEDDKYLQEAHYNRVSQNKSIHYLYRYAQDTWDTIPFANKYGIPIDVDDEDIYKISFERRYYNFSVLNVDKSIHSIKTYFERKGLDYLKLNFSIESIKYVCDTLNEDIVYEKLSEDEFKYIKKYLIENNPKLKNMKFYYNEMQYNNKIEYFLCNYQKDDFYDVETSYLYLLYDVFIYICETLKRNNQSIEWSSNFTKYSFGYDELMLEYFNGDDGFEFTYYSMYTCILNNRDNKQALYQFIKEELLSKISNNEKAIQNTKENLLAELYSINNTPKEFKIIIKLLSVFYDDIQSAVDENEKIAITKVLLSNISKIYNKCNETVLNDLEDLDFEIQGFINDSIKSSGSDLKIQYSDFRT